MVENQKDMAQAFMDAANPALKTNSETGAMYNDKITLVKKQMAGEAGSQHLSMKTIMRVHEALIEACVSEFTVITKKTRADRRAVKSVDTLSAYADCAVRSTEQIEQLLIGNMDKVLKDCNIDMMQYEQSNMYWSQINPQFAYLTIIILDKLKLLMKPSKTCTLEKVLEVFDFQIKEYPKLQLKHPNPQLLPLIKQTWLADLVFENFGLEEEDFITTPGLESNIEFKKRAQTLGEMIQMDSAMIMQQMGMGDLMPQGMEGMMAEHGQIPFM